jgi:hypothetical protein
MKLANRTRRHRDPKAKATARSKRRTPLSAVQIGEFLKSIPEPTPPPDFQEFLRERLIAFDASSDPIPFAAELMSKFLDHGDYWKEVLKDALTRWIYLCFDDPGFAERAERWKRGGEIDSNGLEEFRNYVTARAERAEEAVFEKLTGGRKKGE